MKVFVHTLYSEDQIVKGGESAVFISEGEKVVKICTTDSEYSSGNAKLVSKECGTLHKVDIQGMSCKRSVHVFLNSIRFRNILSRFLFWIHS